MQIETLSSVHVGDMFVQFVTEPNSSRVGLVIVPADMADATVEHRPTIAGRPEIDAVPFFDRPPAIRVVPLVQLKLVGDAYPGAFAQGRTMLMGESNDRFRLVDQRQARDGEANAFVTTLRDDVGLTLRHTLAWHDGDAAVRVHCAISNGSTEPVTLEMFSSFSLGGITPFAADDAPDRLRVHRFRSSWSAEARLDSQTIEQLHLERSWAGSVIFSERFGQVGSHPVRGWFPFVAIEDVRAGVMWGAQLAWAGSWQIEVARQHDDVLLAGGLADREFGHWMKTLAPGETLAAPPATLSCVRGDVDALCDRLTSVQRRDADAQPAVEHDLPIVFNEWCTTWGRPTHERVVEIARRLRGTPTKYLVIDDGWFVGDGGDRKSAHGDWVVDTDAFPGGLAATAAAVREQGLIPGLWFEMETVGRNAAGFGMTDLLLHRDGRPITASGRRFWDMNHPAATDRLADRMIGLLERCGIGYVKIDYNETIGIGTSRGPADSLGEGLRQHIEGVHHFVDRLRASLPDLVIENCASGGHRLEPSMVGRTAMSSFSDAHELVEIPIIAANVQRLVLPRQSQIWAVLHASDSERRLMFSLAATFLGRMCLSGEIDRLSEPQMRLVLRAQRLYRDVWPIIKYGVSRRTSTVGESWRHPRGWQAVTRVADGGGSALVVAHRFADEAGRVEVRLPRGEWRIDGSMADAHVEIDTRDGQLSLHLEPFEAAVVHIARC